MDFAGETTEGLRAARAVLAARDADLADADHTLIQAVVTAHAAAQEAIGRIEGIAADIDAVASGPPAGSPAAGREMSRALLDKQREITAAIDDARGVARAKTAVLQELAERYRVR